MSNIYIQEPPTNGKILLQTTVGDIVLELWSKEAPLACRNFVQLCLEGYYDNTIFHRLVSGFIVQGGDPSGTGYGGESVYGEPFKDEFHSRLRFIRRGLVACANDGSKNSNGSQFFFTLDATPELQNKHPIFAQVTGKTLFNMLKLGESEVDANEKPVFINKILKTEVLRNPFDDIVPRETKKAVVEEAQVEAKAKATKNFGLLSFGEEAEEEEEETVAAATVFRAKAKSSHDLAADPLLSSETVLVTTVERPPELRKENVTKIQDKIREAAAARKDEEESTRVSQKDLTKAEELRKKALELQNELLRPRIAEESAAERKEEAPSSSAVNEYKTQIDVYEARRRKKGQNREEKVMAKLESFRNTLKSVRVDSEETEPKVDSDSQPNSDKSDIDNPGWMKHALSFEAEAKLARDANLRNEADWYDIYDPRNPLNKRKRQAGQETGKKRLKSPEN